MASREERRNVAIKRRKRRQEEEARKVALLSDSQKQRHIRRFGRSKVKLLPSEVVDSFKLKSAEEHTGKLKVLFLSALDYAFLGYSLAESLKAIDIEAKAISRKYNSLRPQSEQGCMCSRNEIVKSAQEAYTIVWMHSLYTTLPIQVLKEKKCVVFHGGTRYRQRSEKMNKQFNGQVHLSLVQTGELLDRGAMNEHWLLPPVDVVGIQPDYSFENADKLVIGHFTSHLSVARKASKMYVKGTSLIESVLDSLKQSETGSGFIYRNQGMHLLPWKENLERMAKCDIYIESLSHAQKNNKNKHDWSVQALEACALGCITITNFLFEERYKKEYGEHGLLVANTGEDLRKILISLFQKSRKELFELKHKARQWVEELHSYNAVGKRLKSILEL